MEEREGPEEAARVRGASKKEVRVFFVDCRSILLALLAVPKRSATGRAGAARVHEKKNWRDRQVDDAVSGKDRLRTGARFTQPQLFSARPVTPKNEAKETDAGKRQCAGSISLSLSLSLLSLPKKRTHSLHPPHAASPSFLSISNTPSPFPTRRSWVTYSDTVCTDAA